MAFRNDSDKGASPFTIKECILVHNYAIQFLGLKKYSSRTPFWTSAPPLGPIKAKFIEYLQGIEYRLRILSETPRENFNNTIVKVTEQGLFVEYESKKIGKLKPGTQKKLNWPWTRNCAGCMGKAVEIFRRTLK